MDKMKRENDRWLKMRGVLAVPGEYEKDGVRYVKTAAELRDAAERYPILPITFGHYASNEPVPPSAQIGTVSQKWSESQQKVLADYWYDKTKMPEVLRLRAYDGHPLAVSAQFLADEKDDEDVLHGIAYHSVATLEGEDPVCPLDQCGAFVVAESQKSNRLIFNERLEDLETEEQQEAEAPPEAPAAELPDEEPAAVVAPETPKTETPVEQKPADPDEPVEEPAQEVPLEPEVIIPTHTPVVQKSIRHEDGVYSFVPAIFRQKQEKE